MSKINFHLEFIELQQIPVAYVDHIGAATDGKDIFVTPGKFDKAQSENLLWFHSEDNSITYHAKRCHPGEATWAIGLAYLENYHNKRVLLLTGGRLGGWNFRDTNCVEIFDLTTMVNIHILP